MFKLSTKCSVSNILFRGAPRQVIPVLLAACSVEFPLQLAPFYIFCWPETWRQICTELPFSPSATLLFCCTLFNTFSLPEDSRAAPDLIMQISRARTHARTFRHGTHSPMWCPINVKLFPGRLLNWTVGVASYCFKN